MHEVIHYLDENENDLYQDWLDGLRDRIAKSPSSNVSHVLRRVYLGTTSPCETVSASCELMWGLGTVSITHKLAIGSYCSPVVATRFRRAEILTEQLDF